MKYYLVTALVLITSHVTDAQMTSPDGKYVVEYFDADAAPHESNVKFKSAKSGKILRYEFSSGYEEKTFQEVAWSADSSYLAVVSRGTKTSSYVRVFSFVEGKVEEVKMPNPKMGDADWSGRYYFVKHLKWEGATLKYYCYGDKVAGGGDAEFFPDNWYHFDVVLKFEKIGDKSSPKVIAVTATNPKWKGEQDDADQPATAPESKPLDNQKPNPESKSSSQ